MPSIYDLFLDVYTSGVTDIDLHAESTWNDAGLPMIRVYSSGNVPDGMMLKTLLYPSGDVWSGDDLTDLLATSNQYNLNNYISTSGYYYSQPFTFIGSGISYEKEYVLNKSQANSHYMLGYVIYLENEFGEQQIYDPVANPTNNLILSKANKPDADNINIVSNLYSESADECKLWLHILRTTELNNYELSNPAPYLVIISGIYNETYYNPSGDMIGSEYNSSNYFTESTASGMFLSLPYISGIMHAVHIYDISLINIDQDGVQSPILSFNTEKIKTSSDDFYNGNLESFESINVKKIGEIPIKNDVITKKRLMIGVEDVALINSEYTKKGTYVSEYYNLDDPIYTFSMKSSEIFPSINGINPYDTIKYYVQFHDQEWIRISTINRDEEYSNNLYIPKFIVLDKLNMGNISTQISEYIYDFPVYSFRIKIDIDMSFITGINFVSPMILSYECNVTDRNYSTGFDNE